MVDYENILEYWQNQNLKTEDDIRTILDNFKILFAYNSNKIENEETSYHNTREIFENGKVINYTGDLRTLFEIQNQKESFDYLIDKIVNKKPITKDLILGLHNTLCKGCYDETRYNKGERPGTFKINDYGVGDDIGVYPEEVEGAIVDLCNELQESEGADPLTIAAYLHLQFESIHPFADGNGRVGRTLMNYYLMIHNYPPTIIYDEDKKTYYMALAVYDKADDINGFMQFIKEQTVKTWNNRVNRVSSSDNGLSTSDNERKSIRRQIEEMKRSETEASGSDMFLGLDTGI